LSLAILDLLNHFLLFTEYSLAFPEEFLQGHLVIYGGRRRWLHSLINILMSLLLSALKASDIEGFKAALGKASKEDLEKERILHIACAKGFTVFA